MLARLLRIVVATAIVLCSCAAPSAPAVAATPQLQVAGNRLVDSATGATFVSRGVNWPSFEYACYWGYGYSNERADNSVGPDAQDAAALASWRINTVRLPLNQDCWLGDDGLPKSDQWTQRTAAGYRQAVQDWVALLHAQGIAVILDLHWSGPNGAQADGQRAMADERSDDFWASVAATFRDDRGVMFDLFNEPYSRWEGNTLAFDLTWDCWRNGGCDAPLVNESDQLNAGTYKVVGMQALVDAVRGAGAKQPILLAGRNYANDLTEWLARRPADDQLVASFHNYPGQGCDTVACWDTEVAAVAAQVPVVTTEFSQDDCKDGHVKSFMDWADRHGVGYLMWEWVLPDAKVVCGESSAYSLIADANGTPRAPLGTALKAHLAALGG
jgi:hypothetical protein